MIDPDGVAERTELITATTAEAVAGLLDVDLPDLERDGIPLLWHWFYLLDRPRQVDLGPDGHPIRKVVVAPPKPGQRRMWAGGRVTRLAPLIVGAPATRRSQVVSTTEKAGSTGKLTFVTVIHKVTQDGRTVVVEEQDIVYRPESTDPAPEPVAAERAPVSRDEWEIPIDPTLLFRFSALTYNSHRIHYDRSYARDVEHYPGLVTHGPLQAIAMAEAARRAGARGPLKMDYRLVSPLFDHQGLVTAAVPDGDGWATSVRDIGGRQTARGAVHLL